MYSSSYSRAKLGLEARDKLHKPKGKSCSYYMKIFLFFSSLIQSLIIVSLVLFLIYGQPEKTAEEQRVKELELSFQKVSDHNVGLRKNTSDLRAQLAARTAEKASLERVVLKLKSDANNTEQELKKKIAAGEKALSSCMLSRRSFTPVQPPAVIPNNELKTLQSLTIKQKDMITFLQTNFTRTVENLSQERDRALKDRDVYLEEAITLRRESSLLKEQLTAYTRKCKEDFANSLNGIQTVTEKFLDKIKNVFPLQQTFYLTCASQNERLEKIKNSCTNLSRDIENKFQLYLDNVGNKVAEIQSLSSQLEVLNRYLTSDLQQCKQTHSEAVSKAAKDLELKQKAHDDQVEKLLIEQNQLREQRRLQDLTLAQKDKEIQALQGMLPNSKAGPPNTGSLQTAFQQVRQPAANLAHGSTAGVSKAPTVG
ncbi:plasmalemma vesicle associated protein b [Austrofundulus limnaeus]|uniref:Plasmalemma vesicle associated protein b n=1 Tax=Austrofundulus limnaeus TaxID=52670 RepID=A0A2I4B4X2_AUSLI|nr:PREDICTED: plasmalemma vesicle-associated protein [Austrofundulus limnaeus]